MGIEEKHAYRFGYLKSEAWSNVRLEALAREAGKCQICGEESLSNDAHHIWYPENIWETRAYQLAILCRPCHDFLHCILPESKTSDEEKGRAQWLQFVNAIIAWRRQKANLFSTEALEQAGIKADVSTRELREAYVKLKQQFDAYKANLIPAQERSTPQDERRIVLNTLQRWYEAYAPVECPNGQPK